MNEEFEKWFESYRAAQGWPAGWSFLTVIRAACWSAWQDAAVFS